MTEISANDPRLAMARQRTALAELRSSLALDRTTLAWIRTALTFETFGLGMIGFFRTLHETSTAPRAAFLHAFAIKIGVAMVVIGLVSLMLTAGAHALALRRLRGGAAPRLPVLPLSVAVAVVVALLSLYALTVVLP